MEQDDARNSNDLFLANLIEIYPPTASCRETVRLKLLLVMRNDSLLTVRVYRLKLTTLKVIKLTFVVL